MGGNPLEVCESQQRWGQRALATSRTQQNVCKDQWELIIENGNAQACAIADLKKELELLQVEVGSQRGELHSCSGSVSRLDRLITQQTQRMIEDLQVDIENNMAHLERRCQEEIKMREDHLLGMVNAKLQEQQELWANREQDGRCSSDVWASIKKEQYTHEVYIQDMLRRSGATIKELESRTSFTQEHVERLEKELRAFMKEHDTGVVSGKEELRRFCNAIKAGLDARVTCLHERVGDFEKGLDAHVDWIQGELRQLHARSQHEQDAQGASFRESAIRVEKELDMHVDWVQGELHRLDAAMQAEQDARAASSREWASRLEEQEARGKSHEWTARVETELDGHVRWVKGELCRLRDSFKEGQDLSQTELRHLGARLGAEEQAHRVERQEGGQRCARLEGLLNEMDCRLRGLQDDLRGHWHALSVTEHVQCGPAEPPGATLTSRREQRSPERTWESFGPEQSGPVQQGLQQADDVVISGSALFGSSPGRTEMPSLIESVDD
mmetsp:Transcript_21282/g.60238  ORF Transcript_21282/g.60238 Transcript_21282/m.60238 type:complete len:499 (-) Transcript_21282:221-1717(-)